MTHFQDEYEVVPWVSSLHSNESTSATSEWFWNLFDVFPIANDLTNTLVTFLMTSRDPRMNYHSNVFIIIFQSFLKISARRQTSLKL